MWGIGAFPELVPPAEPAPGQRRQHLPREDKHLRSTRAVTGYASDVRTGDHSTSGPMEGKIYRWTVLEPGDVVTVYERYF